MAHIKVAAAQTHTPEYLLHKYWARKPHNILASFLRELVPEGGTVVDPFCGSGVVLREAQKLGYAAYGFDVNPAACLISRVLVDPPETKAFQETVAQVLDGLRPVAEDSYSEGDRKIRYCVHAIVARCAACGQVQRQREAVPKGKRGLLCHACGARLRLNLEYLADTEITGLCTADAKELVTEPERLKSQEEKSRQSLFQTDLDGYSFVFAENRRILAFDGMETRDLFTPRNFSILCRLAEEFSAISDERVRRAAQLLLSASAAQCSRLIAARNNLSTGGPAWSIPGFWVPAVHLETNPLVHLRARLDKFVRGLEEIHRELPARNVRVEKQDARQGLRRLTEQGVRADLVFFDPPYGDSVPYVEFSSIWNSLLKDFPDPDGDMSVSDRLPAAEAWANYGADMTAAIGAIRANLKPEGKLLITFNNNDIRAWRVLLSALQTNQMVCEFVTYQIPAVVSSKAQKAIQNSYISDIYSIYRKAEDWEPGQDTAPVARALEDCARYRGGTISGSLARRTMLLAWLEHNLSAERLDEMAALQSGLFEEREGILRLRGCEPPKVSPFQRTARRIARDMLAGGACEWRALYERVAAAAADHGIPDPHEVQEALEGAVLFEGKRCRLPRPEEAEQLSLYDFMEELEAEN